MAANINIRNWIRADDGTRINAATVEVFASGTLGVPTTTPSATTSSEATEGRWAFEGLDDATIWDIKITSGSQVRWLKGGASAQWHNLAAYNLFIKNAFTLNNLTVAQTATVGTLSATAGRATDLAVTNGLSVGSLSGNLVAQVSHRQGGDASDWDDPGTTNYVPGAVRVQVGVVDITFAGTNTATATVTFPVAFSAAPVVVVTGGVSLINIGVLTAPVTTGFVATGRAVDGSTPTATYRMYWVAVGPW